MRNKAHETTSESPNAVPSYLTLTGEDLFDVELTVRDYTRKVFDAAGLRLPGTKALDFIPEYRKHLQRLEVLPPNADFAPEYNYLLLEHLMNGNYLEDFTDGRVKRCRFCGFGFRDVTKPKNAVYCSDECRKVYHSEKDKKAYRAKKEAEGKTVGYVNKRDRYYDPAHGLWANEQARIAFQEQYERPMGTDSIETLTESIQRRSDTGEYYNPKHRGRDDFDYDGSDTPMPRFSGYGEGFGRYTDDAEYEGYEVTTYTHTESDSDDDQWDEAEEFEGMHIIDLQEYEEYAKEIDGED